MAEIPPTEWIYRWLRTLALKRWTSTAQGSLETILFIRNTIAVFNRRTWAFRENLKTVTANFYRVPSKRRTRGVVWWERRSNTFLHLWRYLKA